MKQRDKKQPCGCCEGTNVLTPVEIFNRPGLDALVYRAGAHGGFLETMKARLSSAGFPKLAGLTARDGDDASIAMLDAWATVADVLTFYQERIANEGYLRTATERRSALEMARLIGYRPKPGVAASVYLAYTLEPTQESVVIEKGNKAQSAPGPDELPQTFETAEKLEALSALNALNPRLGQPQFFSSIPGAEDITIYLQGTSTNLRPNDVLLLRFGSASPKFYRVEKITPEPELNRTTVELFSPPVTGANIIGEIAAAASFDLGPSLKEIADEHLQTAPAGKIAERVSARLQELSEPSEAPEELTKHLEETILPELVREHSAIAGNPRFNKVATWMAGIIGDFENVIANTAARVEPAAVAAINGGTAPVQVEDNHQPHPTFAAFLGAFAQPQSVQPLNEARLNRRFDQIYAAQSGFLPRLFATVQPRVAPFVTSALTNAQPRVGSAGIVELSKVEFPRQKAFLAGHNLPTVTEITKDQSGRVTSVIPISPPSLGQYVNVLALAGFRANTQGLNFIALDSKYEQIIAGGSIAITRPFFARSDALLLLAGFKTSTHIVKDVRTASLRFPGASLPITIEATVLELDFNWLSAADIGTGISSTDFVRSTTVYVQSEELTRAERPIAANINFVKQNPDTEIELNNFYPGLESGRWAIISGERMIPAPNNSDILVNSGVRVAELLMISSVSHEAKTVFNDRNNDRNIDVPGGKLHTFIRPAQPPAYIYKRDTVTIYGNIVRATHGETRNEVLGSGDGSRKLQSFPLRQPPLTYLAAATPSGAQSTLEVRVNDVLWRESGNLFVLNPNDRRYITRTGDDGKTAVVFGNGEHGALLPTGVENIKAVYRSGIGKAGNVKAEQIKLLMTKPLGVKGVINPSPASGGADHETRDQIRRNAPIAVLALDRLVSVRDYADFARAFAGIGKAHSQRLSDGNRLLAHVTIAGANDILIDRTSDLYRNLVAALKQFGDPFQSLQVDVFERVLLVVSAKVSLDPDYLWEAVKPKIRAALLEKFGFEARELGQDVTQSEVISAIQAIPGVMYIDLEKLDSIDEKKLADPNFNDPNFKEKLLALRPRVNAELARTVKNAVTNKPEILPAQLVFLSPDANDTIILEEVPK